MELFFPFIYQKQKQEYTEQISLYIDDYVMPDEIEIKEEDERISIIQIT